MVGCYFLCRCCGCMKPGRHKCRQVSLPRSKWMDQRNADPLGPRTSSFLTLRSLFVPLCVSVYAHHHQQTSLSIGISLSHDQDPQPKHMRFQHVSSGRAALGWFHLCCASRSFRRRKLTVQKHQHLSTDILRNRKKTRNGDNKGWIVIRYSFLLAYFYLCFIIFTSTQHLKRDRVWLRNQKTKCCSLLFLEMRHAIIKLIETSAGGGRAMRLKLV